MTDQSDGAFGSTGAGRTPGPWQVHGSHVYGPNPERALVAQVLSDHGRLVDDRNLIAAAPDLLAACEAFIAALEGANVDYDDLAANTRAAIALATGAAA